MTDEADKKEFEMLFKLWLHDGVSLWWKALGSIAFVSFMTTVKIIRWAILAYICLRVYQHMIGGLP